MIEEPRRDEQLRSRKYLRVQSAQRVQGLKKAVRAPRGAFFAGASALIVRPYADEIDAYVSEGLHHPPALTEYLFKAARLVRAYLDVVMAGGLDEISVLRLPFRPYRRI